MRVLVTGATGFIGQVLIRHLVEHGHQPMGLVRSLTRVQLPPAGPVIVGAVDEPLRLGVALKGEQFDAVVHLAGLSTGRESWQDPARYYQVNVGGTANLLKAVELTGPKAFVFASSYTVYGAAGGGLLSEQLQPKPVMPYAATKYTAEQLVDYTARADHIGAVNLRIFNAAGATPDFADRNPTRIVSNVIRAAAGLLPHVSVNGDGSTVRDFVHVVDVAEAIRLALDVAEVGKAHTVNVGSGVGTSMMQIIEAARQASGRAVAVVHNPPVDEPAELVADISRAGEVLKWQPTRSTIDRIVGDAWTHCALSH